MASNEEMRKYVSSAYSGEGWKARVKKMSEAQIFAVYNNLIKKDKDSSHGR